MMIVEYIVAIDVVVDCFFVILLLFLLEDDDADDYGKQHGTHQRRPSWQ